MVIHESIPNTSRGSSDHPTSCQCCFLFLTLIPWQKHVAHHKTNPIGEARRSPTFPWRPIFPELLILQVVHFPQQPIHLFAVRIKAQDLRGPWGSRWGDPGGDPKRVPSGEDINVLYINSPNVAL